MSCSHQFPEQSDDVIVDCVVNTAGEVARWRAADLLPDRAEDARAEPAGAQRRPVHGRQYEST